MNILDTAVFILLVLFILSGVYKRFMPTILNMCATIVSGIFGLAFMNAGASIIKGNATVFNMLLYYSEGSEFIGDVELARTAVDTLSHEQVVQIVNSTDLPYPFGREVIQNINNSTFADMNITTLGDYFNQTIVCVVINIIVFIVIFALVKVVLSFVLGGIDYGIKLPKLAQFDAPISGGFGLLNGMFILFVVFMAAPLILIIMNFDFVHNLLDNSFFAPFFYHSSFMLGLIPGT